MEWDREREMERSDMIINSIIEDISDLDISLFCLFLLNGYYFLSTYLALHLI